MGIAIFFVFNNSAISGCAGDCITCHPVLAESVEHASLKTCVTCHDPAKRQLLLFTSNDGCGDRCFLCHEKWPADGAHAGLDTCLSCHNK